MIECYLLDPKIVREIEWTGDAESYDRTLRKLGPNGEPFLVQNPWVSDSRPFYFIDDIPNTKSCVVWTYKGEWQAKYFPAGWRPRDGYTSIEIAIPKFIWRKNPDLDRAMTFDEDVFGSFKPDSWQAQHELIWYMDPRFNPLDDKVWAISCKPMGKPILGIIDMGFVTPQVDIEYNPDLPEFDLDIDSLMPPYWELCNANAYRLDPKYETDSELYVLVIKPRYRNPKSWSYIGLITPELKFTLNKTFPQLDIEIEDNFVWHDLFYEHIWYIDSNFLYPGQEDVWLVKAKAIGKVKGTKHHGKISPKCHIEYNPDIAKLSYDLDLNFKIDDLGYEHVWYLHSDHHPYTAQKLWAVKVLFTKDTNGVKHHGDISPSYIVRVIKQLKDIEFNIDIKTISYFDFVYTNCFYMKNPNNDVLAVEVDFVKKPVGTKHRGFIKPVYKIEYNPEVKNIRVRADHEITFDDRNYLHVWYLINEDNELIWLAKSSICKNPKGEKTIAYVETEMPEKLDVFFISYGEPNAEENWLRVIDKAPYAKRIDGVQGIFNAHKAAADAAETDMFYVVDGDAWLLDEWKFDYQPGIFDRDCTFIWHSHNPITGLEYGHGGVKLFPVSVFKKEKSNFLLDISTGVNSKLKVIDKASNVTSFNVNEFATWRTAFREVVKLCRLCENEADIDSKERLRVWSEIALDVPFAQFSLQAAKHARVFYEKHKDNNLRLLMVNDIDWLKSRFREIYPELGRKMSEDNYNRIQKVIPIINGVSKSFCLAKWFHSTIYLQTGETHSCYHPAPHYINLNEIGDNPSALHNTNSKKAERKEMLEGVQTAGCQYCWNIENLGVDHVSDRHIKSGNIYTPERFERASTGQWDQNVNPEYVEISFGNECNFKCGYCHPKASSRFYNEIKEHGPVTTVKNHRCDIDWMKIYEREEDNPYVDAWWQWWPELRKELSILRITGGEPLMHTSTWKLLDSIDKDPMPWLELNINSNLGVKASMVDKMITKVNNILDGDKIKTFKLFTSIDTWGPRAEYLRTGLDLKLWERNLDAYLRQTGQPVGFMITFNILSVTTFKQLLEKILEWRTTYNDFNKTFKPQIIRFDTPYLKEPLQYDMNILPKEDYLPYMYESLDFIKNNMDDNDLTKFNKIEYEKFRRVVDYMKSSNYSNTQLIEGRKDFYNWFSALDLRRNTNFLKIFPEMKKFYNYCRALAS